MILLMSTLVTPAVPVTKHFPDPYLDPQAEFGKYKDCDAYHDYLENLPPYFDHCDVSPVRIGAFLSSPFICSLGPKMPPYSLDLHIYGISNFVGGRDEVLRSGLPHAAQVVKFIETACLSMQEESMESYRLATHSLSRLGQTQQHTEVHLPRRATVKIEPPPYLGHLERVGGSLRDTYNFHFKNTSTSLPSRPCGDYTMEYDRHISQALKISKAARLFMDDIRTRIAIKLTHLVVSKPRVPGVDMSFPHLRFHPELYATR